MKKSTAIITLVLIIALTLGIGFIDIKGTDAQGTASAKDISLGLDLAGGVSITYQVVGDENPDTTDMADTIYKLQQRVEGYSTEAIVYQEGTNRINIEIPGVSDANAILQELGKPGQLYFISETDDNGAANYSYTAEGYVLNKTIDELLADGSIRLQGTDVADARAVSTQDNLKNTTYAVALTMTDEGKQKFADATSRAYKNNETLAIYYDGAFVSVPTVSGALTTGEAQITGTFTFEEAEKLASTIRIGGLSLELEELHSKVVGAQLGQDAISTSLKAGLFGFIAVAIFMIAVYFMPGFCAVLALIAYVALIVLLLNGFDMTLTLAGIAGIILSVGMAVDANVVIFARIREEIAAGFSVESAIKTGFNKALSAILDGNITTLIAAIVLWILGPGSVKGFAQTLVLGIVLSMFTALVVTRLLIMACYALGMKDAKFYGRAKDRKSVNFLSKRVVFFVISAVVIIAGVCYMGVNKFALNRDELNYSLEFKGGTATTVDFDKAWSLDELTAQVAPEIEDVTGSNVQIQTISGTNEVIFKTNSLSVETRENLENMFTEKFAVPASKITTETISSTISSEMKRDTIIAVVVAIVLMLIYIRIRFKDMRFGISSIIALAHDVLVVIAFYAFARVSVGNTFVACLLTIVGYSINATIVIFDRIRENTGIMVKEDLKEIVNKSVTQTLSRSIFTSLTTFIMVAFLFGFGVSSIRDFALPLMVGIACGCYSSVCLAGALWYTFKTKFAGKKKA
ncbi:MAG: protein translocase subunit SecD [Lachnospiraceae bacterium]|nr:protein translocase subunit SecD [Lachnospiraceae bacterium]